MRGQIECRQCGLIMRNGFCAHENVDEIHKKADVILAERQRQQRRDQQKAKKG